MKNQKSGNTLRKRLYFYSTPEPNTGCWLWTGAARNKKHDYGSLMFNRKVTYAHRLSYQEFKGEIPDGYEVLHACDTPACINPDHLSIGTHTDNMQDCLKKNRNPYMIKRTHCARGHEFTEENTYKSFRGLKPERSCRACVSMKKRK